MKKYNILWIDDDINRQELMPERDALNELGCIITAIPHPDNFRMETVPFYDCIIIDLSMPIGGNMTIDETGGGTRTGFVLLKKIKNKYPNSKIVVYSIFDAPDVRSYCNDNGIECWNKSSLLSDEFALSIVELIEKEIK